MNSMIAYQDVQETGGRAEPRGTSRLLARTLDACAWRFLTELARVGVQLGVLVVLARLVPVEAFGVLSLAMIVLNFAHQVPELGIGPAVIQKPRLTHKDVRVAFTICALGGVGGTLLLLAAAPLAAAVFEVPEVAPVIRLLSLAFLLTSLNATAVALLERRLLYRKLLKLDLVSYGLGYAAVGITLGLLGHGVWSLAWAMVAAAALRSVLLFAASPRLIRPSLAREEARHLLTFGAGTSLCRLANYMAFNADYFVVGRFLGTVALGLYTRAYQVMTLPMYQFSGVISAVLFPAYALIQGDTPRLRRAYLGSVALSALVVWPLFTGIAIVAPEVMSGVFGPNWAPAAGPLQILCLGGVFQCMYKPADSLARARGAVYLQLPCHATYAVCVIVGSLVGSRWGINGVAVGVTGALAVVYLLTAALSLHLLECDWWSGFVRPQLPGLVLAAAVACLALPVCLLLRSVGSHPLTTLPVTLAVSLAAAGTAGALLPRGWVDPTAGGVLAGLVRACLGKCKSLAKHVLRHNTRVYKRVEMVYENLLYLPHLVREGLHRTACGFGRRTDAGEGQAVLAWDVPFPPRDNSDELAAWLRCQGVTVQEGGHTLYLPPQPALRGLLPAVVDFYPPGCGFKILKDFRPPSEARYLRSDYRHVRLLLNLIGKPREQLVSANYLHSLGLGPRVWDLTCWRGGGKSYTVFVVEHADGGRPTSEQHREFLDRLKGALSTTHLRVLIPLWEENMDFRCPDCNNNLLYSPELGRSLYVDFQNFGLTRRDAWSEEIVGGAKERFHFGMELPFRGGRYLYQSVPGFSSTGKRDTTKRWATLTGALRDASVDLPGRLVLDVGCNSGMILQASLGEGAAWGLGWDLPSVVPHARSLLHSLGTTRFTLSAAEMNPSYPLEKDIPARFRERLEESVVFYLSVRQHIGLLDSLRTMPWRAMVYEGHESETLEETYDLLKAWRAPGVEMVNSFYITDGISRSRPVVLLRRR